MKLKWKLLLLAVAPIPLNAFYMATSDSAFAEHMRYWDPLFFLGFIWWAGTFCRGKEMSLIQSLLTVHLPGLLCLAAGWVQLLAGLQLPVQLGNLYVSMVRSYAEIVVEVLPGLAGVAAEFVVQLLAAVLILVAFTIGYLRPPKPKTEKGK